MQDLSIESNRSDDLRRKLIMAAILVASVFIAYWPVLHCQFIWDDAQYVFDNKNLRDVEGLCRIWTEPLASPQYYPMVHTTFWIEHHFFGNEPLVYHLVNILLHMGNAFLLWAILARLKLPGAFAAAIIFAIHPVCMESVAWITERKNLLSGFFYLLSAMAYFKFSPPDQSSAVWRKWPWLIAATAMFATALLSKSVTASLPAAIGLILWWKRGRLSYAEIAILVVMLAIGAAAGLHTAQLERVRVGAVGADWNLSFVQRTTIAGMAVWFYAWKLLLPVNLIFIYPRWNPAELGGYIIFTFALLAVIAALFAFRKRIGRGPLAAVLFFVGTLFPALGFFNVFPHRFSFVADHFQYLACIGIIALAVGAISTIVFRFGQNARIASSVVLLIVMACYVSQIWSLAPQYENEEKLWIATIEKNDQCWLAYNNLGCMAGMKADRQQDPELLITSCALLKRSLDLNPNYEVANCNMGFCLQKMGRFADARERYVKALELTPGYANALKNLEGLTRIAARLRNRTEYRLCLEQLVRFCPGNAEYRMALDHFNAVISGESGAASPNAASTRPGNSR